MTARSSSAWPNRHSHGNSPLSARSEELRVPSGVVCVCTTANDVVLQAVVPEKAAAVSIWTNDLDNPSVVEVVIS
jgi:hypothetical protein